MSVAIKASRVLNHEGGLEESDPPRGGSPVALERIRSLDMTLQARYSGLMVVEPKLSRDLVSYQANKGRPGYRWFKYKEAFSAQLVEQLLSKLGWSGSKVLDPFAGMGTTLFTARDLGMDSVGIELLPVGQVIIEDRLAIDFGLTSSEVDRIRAWMARRPWESSPKKERLNELRITHGAYPPATTDAIERYVSASAEEAGRVAPFLRLALLSVLETVSYTRKDGQYLRWDQRAGRRIGASAFDKGEIPDFGTAITAKLAEMLNDVQGAKGLRDYWLHDRPLGTVELLKGSCLDLMPRMAASSCDVIVTSPPYCNRYDYTRTYALELALLGVGEKEMVALRQAMLSCTVENRAKNLLSYRPDWQAPVMAADKQELLQAILAYLEAERAAERLNNSGIPRMVRGYFYEMSCVIWECARVLKPGATLVMVNDNVRYAGASISVDIILTNLAEQFGLVPSQILVLPNGKGNSSQQMGEHGRDPLRKCVYVWRKA